MRWMKLEPIIQSEVSQKDKDHYNKIHFSSHVTIELRNGSLLYRIREASISRQRFFLFSISSCGNNLSSFLTFPICFKCWTTVEWLMLSSSATSHIAVRGSASMILSGVHCQLSMASHHALHLQGSHLLWKLLEPPLALYLLVNSSWAKCIADVASCLCCFNDPFWTRIGKSLKFAFCLTSFPWV